MVRRFMKGETVQRPAESGGKKVDARAAGESESASLPE